MSRGYLYKHDVCRLFRGRVSSMLCSRESTLRSTRGSPHVAAINSRDSALVVLQLTSF